MLLQHYKEQVNHVTAFFGELIRRRRVQLRLRLRDVALRAEMDPGNLSKLERGRLRPPQDRGALDRICLALQWHPAGSDAEKARDLAAVENGRIPNDLLEDDEVMAKLPLLLRIIHSRELDPDELERLIDLIRGG